MKAETDLKPSAAASYETSARGRGKAVISPRQHTPENHGRPDSGFSFLKREFGDGNP
jgi:hypothetical protein